MTIHWTAKDVIARMNKALMPESQPQKPRLSEMAAKLRQMQGQKKV